MQKKRRAKRGNERRQTKAARAVQMGNAQENYAEMRVVKGTSCSCKITRGIRIRCESPNEFKQREKRFRRLDFGDALQKEVGASKAGSSRRLERQWAGCSCSASGRLFFIMGVCNNGLI